METKEFEKLKVIFVPKLGIIGLVESNKGPDTVIYSTDVDSNGNNLLIVSVILRGSSFATGHEGLGGLAFVHHELRSFARTATGVEDKWKQASEEE